MAMSALGCVGLVGMLLASSGCQQSSEVRSEATAAASPAPATPPEPLDTAGLNLPPGFRATVFADVEGIARHVAVAPNGVVFVNKRDMSGGGSLVVLQDTDGDGRADRMEYFEDQPGTGVAVYEGHVYFSSDRAVFRRELELGQRFALGPRETMVRGFPAQSSHAAKPLAFDADGQMYVNVGAPSNACQKEQRTAGSPGLRPCPQLKQHGGVWRFDARKTGQTFMQGVRFASGIRHIVALAFDDARKRLMAVQHGRDQLHQLFPKLYSVEDSAELPAEEMLVLTSGFVGGWPYTYFDHRRGQRMVAPEYGGDGKTPAASGTYPDPVFAFPGHYAPNALLFYQGTQFPKRYRGGAFVAFHGSWNRAPLEQRGYNVMFVPFQGAFPAGDAELFADGFAGRAVVRTPGQASHRPTGLAEGPDGALFVSDSKQGYIWRIVFQP